MRLFIAIDFNGFEDYFLGLQRQLPKNAKLSPVKSFHLTLKFLGEVTPDKAEEVAGILRNIKFEKFDAYLDSAGVFPAESCIRVVWVGLKPEEKILELHSKIDESLKGMFKKEKDFKAHITLTRVKVLEDKKNFVREIKKMKVENKKAEINGFSLVKSTLTSEGPVYEELEMFHFG